MRVGRCAAAVCLLLVALFARAAAAGPQSKASTRVTAANAMSAMKVAIREGVSGAVRG